MTRKFDQVLTEWLVLQVQSGNREAWETLARIWYAPLRRYAQARLRHREDASRPMGLFGMLNLPLRGNLGPIALVAFVFMFAALGMLIYSAFQFFPETELVRKLNWLAIGLTMLIALGLLRMWYFLEMARLSIIREVKRLELQVSLVCKKLR